MAGSVFHYSHLIVNKAYCLQLIDCNHGIAGDVDGGLTGCDIRIAGNTIIGFQNVALQLGIAADIEHAGELHIALFPREHGDNAVGPDGTACHGQQTV